MPRWSPYRWQYFCIASCRQLQNLVWRLIISRPVGHGAFLFHSCDDDATFVPPKSQSFACSQNYRCRNGFSHGMFSHLVKCLLFKNTHQITKLLQKYKMQICKRASPYINKHIIFACVCMLLGALHAVL